MTDSLSIEEREERQARIDQLMANTLLLAMDTVKREQDIRFAPWVLLATGGGATAALIGAGAALLKWLH